MGEIDSRYCLECILTKLSDWMISCPSSNSESNYLYSSNHQYMATILKYVRIMFMLLMFIYSARPDMLVFDQTKTLIISNRLAENDWHKINFHMKCQESFSGRHF